MKEAVVLAAGRGARLDRPNTPKPLVHLGGVPIIVRTIEQLQQHGIEVVHIVVGYERKRLIRELTSHPWDDIDLVFHENHAWEESMASSVLIARDALPESFLLIMGDHIFDDAIVAKMVGLPAAPGKVVALYDANLKGDADLESALKVELDGDAVTDVGWGLERASGIDAGFFVASHVLFLATEAALLKSDKAGLADGLRELALAGKLKGVSTGGSKWSDIDTPADLVRAEARTRTARREAMINNAITPEERTRQRFDYIAGKPSHTDIVIERGAVKRPDPAYLIPAESASSPVFVFTDETVGDLYGRDFVAQIRARGYEVHLITLPDGEEAKTLSNYTYVVERVLSRGVDERSVFMSVGGGVVCNVCGFVASTIYRGLNLVHLPTTLMAQSDAAISHKQAINGARGKNMVGSYYSPSMVVVDVEVLDTLTDRQYRDGLAEVLKHGLAQDAVMARRLAEYTGDIRDSDFVESLICRNVELKCELVRDDPKELQEGMVLQYGHTVGHPIEHLSGYTLFHGEAVAIGMVVAARVARLMGACGDDVVAAHIDLIRQYGLPTQVPAYIQTADMLSALKFNKRYLREGTRMALVKEVGALWGVDGEMAIPVPEDVLVQAFEQTRADA